MVIKIVAWGIGHPIAMQGHVIRLSEDGGEIRLLESAECIEFHSDGCTSPSTIVRLTCKCEVSFTISRAHSGRRFAKDIKLLPSGMHFNDSEISKLAHAVSLWRMYHVVAQD
jgi:hypothetical protein